MCVQAVLKLCRSVFSWSVECFRCYYPVSSGRSLIKKAKWISKMAAVLFCPLLRKLHISWYFTEDAKERQTTRYLNLITRALSEVASCLFTTHAGHRYGPTVLVSAAARALPTMENLYNARFMLFLHLLRFSIKFSTFVAFLIVRGLVAESPKLLWSAFRL